MQQPVVLTRIADKRQPGGLSRKGVVPGSDRCQPLTLDPAYFREVRSFRDRVGIGRSTTRTQENDTGEHQRDELFSDRRPRAGRDLQAPMRREPFDDDLTVPLWNRNLLGVFGKVVPQRLDVFELFVGRERIESGWRHRGWVIRAV